MNEPILDQIIKARDKCAGIISKYGTRYLPIFERLEKEIGLRQKELVLINKVHEIVKKNGTQIGIQNGTHLTGIFMKIVNKI